MRFPRRYFALLLIAAFAMFFSIRAGDVQVPPETPRHTIEGTVAQVELRKERARHNGRHILVSRSLVQIQEHPKVEFLVERQPHDGLPVGARVLFETEDDAPWHIEAAEKYPDLRQRIKATGLVADGAEIYTTAGNHDRASRTQWGYRLAAMLCWATALVWGVLAFRKHWPAMRRKADELLN